MTGFNWLGGARRTSVGGSDVGFGVGGVGSSWNGSLSIGGTVSLQPTPQAQLHPLQCPPYVQQGTLSNADPAGFTQPFPQLPQLPQAPLQPPQAPPPHAPSPQAPPPQQTLQ